MAVDLGNLIEPVKREVNPPGSDLFPAANDDAWLGYLSDAFWRIRLEIGILSEYSETDGIVTPINVGGEDLSRDMQQLIIFFAGYHIIYRHLMNLKTQFRSKAGPVEYETQQSANVLTEILKDLRDKQNDLLTSLKATYNTSVYYFDALISRTNSMTEGMTYWWG
jgi:hypothetical protein